MNDRVKFYGSNEDLDALRDALTTKGLKEFEDNYIRASQDVIPVSISFVIGTGIGSCIKHWLTVRGKRMVTRETHGEKIVIKGDFSVDEIERLLKIPCALDIEDDIEQLPESNRESEMGFHVGQKQQKDK
jgi:hypothetical protein